MSFRRVAAFTLLQFGIWGASGCAWLGESMPPSDAKMGSKLGRCLEGFAPKLRKYFEGGASPNEIPDLMVCADKALSLVTTVLEPSGSGHYDLKEVRTFLQSKFLGEDQVRNALFEEGMLLKRSVLGGDTERLTVKEVEQTKRLLRILKTVFRDLHPYMPLRSDHAAGMDDTKLEDLRNALHKAAMDVGAFFDKHSQDYTFENLSRLLNEFALQYGRSEGPASSASMPDLIRQSLPLVQVSKDLFVAPGTDAIRPKQWTSLFLAGAKLLYGKLGSERLKQRYDVWFGGEGFDFFKHFMKHVMDDLRWTFQNRNGRDIPLTDLDALVRALKEQDMLPDSLGEQTLVDLLRPVFNTFIPIEGKQGVVSEQHLEALWHQVEKLAAGEMFLRTMFQSLAEPGQDYRQIRYDSKESKDIGLIVPWPPFGFDLPKELRLFPTVSPADILKIGEQFKTIAAGWPLFRGSRHIVSFFRDHVHMYDGLSSVNVVRVFSELILEAYGKSDPGKSITQPEFTMAFDDIKAFGIDMKFVDPRNPVTPQVRFSEGNLFLPSNRPDGEKVLDFNELVEMFAFMSSSIRLGRESHQEIVESKKCSDMRTDIVNQIMVEEACFRYYFFDAFIDRFRPVFPRTSRFYEDLLTASRQPGLTAEERALREAKLLKFEIDVIHPDRTPGMIESVDTVAYVQVLNYVESIFAVYDKNDDGVMDEEEALSAFPRFRTTLLLMLDAEVPKWNLLRFKLRPIRVNDDTARDLLRFLLEKGRKPEGAEFIQYVYGIGRGKVAADRGTLISLLAYLQFKNREIQERRLGSGS